MTGFIFLGSKITANGDYSHKIKTHPPWEKSYHKPAAAAKLLQLCPTLCDPIDSSPLCSAVPGILQARILEWVAISFSNHKPREHIKRQRHHFADKGPYSYSFSISNVQMWEWTIKKPEHQRIDAFELSWWRRLLRVPRTARRSSQSMLKEINPEYSLEGLMLKLKLHYFGHLIWRAVSLGKTLMLGKIRAGGEGGNREWDYCVASLTQWIRVWANCGTLKSRDALNASVHGITKSWTQLHDWTTTSNALSVPPGKSSNDLLYTVKSPSLMGFHTFRK